MNVLGVDIGGSGIKGALVDPQRGQLISERHRIPTPESLMPEEVLAAVLELAGEFDDFDGPIGIGFPAVVVDGTPRTPFTAHHIKEWVGFPVAHYLRERLDRPVTMLNDADAAGIAEMRFGRGRGEQGVVIILTLGTGIGSAVFTGGHLVPNTEFGKLRLPGHKERGELYAAGDVRKRDNLDWETYTARLDEYCAWTPFFRRACSSSAEASAKTTSGSCRCSPWRRASSRPGCATRPALSALPLPPPRAGTTEGVSRLMKAGEARIASGRPCRRAGRRYSPLPAAFPACV